MRALVCPCAFYIVKCAFNVRPVALGRFALGPSEAATRIAQGQRARRLAPTSIHQAAPAHGLGLRSKHLGFVSACCVLRWLKVPMLAAPPRRVKQPAPAKSQPTNNRKPFAAGLTCATR